MSIQGFLADLDKQIDELEKERAKTRVPNNQDKIDKQLMGLRVLKSKAESTCNSTHERVHIDSHVIP